MLRGMCLEKYELMSHWDLDDKDMVPGVDFTILGNHEDVVECQCQWDLLLVKHTLVHFVLLAQLCHSVFELNCLWTFCLSFQIKSLHCLHRFIL